MGVDSLLITADLVDVSHDEQLAAQRLQGLEHALEALGLQRGRDPESEEDVESPDWHLPLQGEGRGGPEHLFKERKADGDTAEALENRTAAEALFFHQSVSVLVDVTRSLRTMAAIMSW